MVAPAGVERTEHAAWPTGGGSSDEAPPVNP